MDDTTLSIMIKLGMQEEENAKVTLAKLESHFKALEKEADNLRKVIQISLDHDEDAGLLKAQLEDVEAQISDTTMAAAKLNREMKQAQWDNLKKLGGDLQQVGDKISNIGRGMSIMGVGILAGVYSSIQKFNEANPLDPTAQRWLKAQTEIERSFLRIGGVAADRLLPLIEKLADLAEKTADFVEKNPEVIDALVGAGSFMAVAGGGLQLAGGAMKIGGGAMDMIAKAGQAGLLTEGGTLATLGTSVGTGITTVLTSTAFLASLAAGLGAVVGVGAYNKYAEATGRDSAGEIGSKGGALALFEISKALREVGINSDKTDAELWAMATATTGAGDAAEESSKRIVLTAEEAAKALSAETKAKEEATKAAEKRAQAETQLAEAYANFIQQEAEAAQQYEQSRAKVTTDANRAALDAKRAHEQSIVKIEADYTKQRADLLNDYKSEDAQAAGKYQQERAQAVRDGGIEIQKIEQDHQKRLAELLDGHNERTSDLIANRDALGLAKENQAYEKSRRAEESKTNEEIGQRRADLALKLQDMAQAYAAERAQRAQALQQALVDAAEQHKSQIAEEQAKFAEDARQRKEQTTRQLNDLATQFREESVRRRNAFLQSIRDLDTALNGETNRKREYYALMLKDANAFMAQWRAQMYPSTTKTTTPIHDYSGYAYTGTYAMAQDGQPEFVLSGAATKAAEQMVGGQLNQQALLSGLAGQGGTGMQYVDHSSYSNVTVADMRRIRQMSRQESIAVMSELQRK